MYLKTFDCFFLNKTQYPTDKNTVIILLMESWVDLLYPMSLQTFYFLKIVATIAAASTDWTKAMLTEYVHDHIHLWQIICAVCTLVCV